MRRWVATTIAAGAIATAAIGISAPAFAGGTDPKQDVTASTQVGLFKVPPARAANFILATAGEHQRRVPITTALQAIDPGDATAILSELGTKERNCLHDVGKILHGIKSELLGQMLTNMPAANAANLIYALDYEDMSRREGYSGQMKEDSHQVAAALNTMSVRNAIEILIALGAKNIELSEWGLI